MKVKVRVSMEVEVDVGSARPADQHALEYVSGLFRPLRTHRHEEIMRILADPPETWDKAMCDRAIAVYKLDGQVVDALLDSAKWEAGKLARAWPEAEKKRREKKRARK